jgi:hypothetical protein
MMRPRVASLRWNFRFSDGLPFAQELFCKRIKEAHMGRGILLWLLGVPIPIIILIFLLFPR